MSENVLTQTTTTEENYLLEENSLYTTTTGPQTQVLQTMAAASTLMEMNGPTGTLSDFTFDVRLSDDLFISNGMVIRASVPIKMTMTNAHADDVEIGRASCRERV